MSDLLSYIQNNPQETQRLIGIKYDQLEQLIKQATTLHTQKQQDIEVKKIRIINKGGGGQVKLSIEDQILLTLTYLRHMTTFQLLGIQFGVSESTANDTFNYWLKIFQELLPPSLLEQVKKNASDYDIVQEILTDYELIVDSSEQSRERPGEYKEQQDYYSGKKQTHTFKNQITVLPDGKDIVDIIAGKPGPKSDVTLFRESKNGFDKNQKFQGDKAYTGEPLMKTPTKKKKNGELTESQKKRNKELASDALSPKNLGRLITTSNRLRR